MKGKIKNLENLILAGLVGLTLAFSPKAKAQDKGVKQYDVCDINNPNYCFECRDESKRDFDKCGEIDYTKYNLAEFDAAGWILKWPNSQIDYDPYRKKAVLSMNIGKKKPKVEIFVVEGDHGELVIVGDDHKLKETVIVFKLYPDKFKRVTYSESNTWNIYPFWTKDRDIVYKVVRGEELSIKGLEKNAYLVDINGRLKRKISRGEDGEYSKFLRESHPRYVMELFREGKKDLRGDLVVEVPPPDYKKDSKK